MLATLYWRVNDGSDSNWVTDDKELHHSMKIMIEKKEGRLL